MEIREDQYVLNALESWKESCSGKELILTMMEFKSVQNPFTDVCSRKQWRFTLGSLGLVTVSSCGSLSGCHVADLHNKAVLHRVATHSSGASDARHWRGADCR